MTLVARSEGSPSSDSGDELVLYPEDHSLFWYLIVIAIEIAVLAGLYVVTRYTIQHRSGLNEPDKIRRIWARAPEIRFQPVVRPLLFAIAVSYGSQTVIPALVVALLSLVGLNGGWVDIIIALISLGLSSLISVLVYRIAGGTNWKVCAAATLGFDWFMAGVIYNLAKRSNDPAGGGGFKGFVIFAALYLLVLSIFQIPFYIWGAYHRLPATARLIYNSSVVPNWVKIDRTILVASAPLSAVYVVAYLAEFRLNCDTYLGNVTLALASIMLLAASAIAAIISVNRALLANEFQWQWRAFLTPAIPMTAMKVLVLMFHLITARGEFLMSVWSAIHFFMSIGGCGTLGAYTYLKLAEKYAQSHIDDDVLAQDDLLAEFEEDEDNEELDV